MILRKSALVDPTSVLQDILLWLYFRDNILVL
jgi:hypothetical protein